VSLPLVLPSSCPECPPVSPASLSLCLLHSVFNCFTQSLLSFLYLPGFSPSFSTFRSDITPLLGNCPTSIPPPSRQWQFNGPKGSIVMATSGSTQEHLIQELLVGDEKATCTDMCHCSDAFPTFQPNSSHSSIPSSHKNMNMNVPQVVVLQDSQAHGPCPFNGTLLHLLFLLRLTLRATGTGNGLDRHKPLQGLPFHLNPRSRIVRACLLPAQDG
jgi:hypothetical protein